MKKGLGLKWAVVMAGAMLLVLAAACAGETEVVEVIKEVPVEVEVIKEIIVEKEVVVEKVVVKEVHVDKVVEKEVVKIVEVIKDVGWEPRAMEPNPKYGGIIRMSAPHRVAHFDFHQGAVAYIGNTSMYNNLVYYNQADGLKTIGPDLASSWDVSSNGLEYTFKLREGVKWHDGVDFSADDVTATFNRIQNPPAGVAIVSSLMDSVSKVEALDSLTVRFTLKNATPWFIEMMASDNYFDPAVIYPKHYMEANNYDLRAENAPGTGAFKLVRIAQDEYWNLEANPDYFVSHLPYADGAKLVNVLPFCDRGTAVLTGQTDFTWNTCGDVVNVALADPRFDAKYATGDIFFMTRSFNSAKAPFDDARVRRAVHLAFDRDVWSAIYMAADGKTYPRTSWVPYYDTANALSQDQVLAAPGWRSDKTEDIATAKQLMADAGYGDGVEVEYVDGKDSSAGPWFAALQSMLKDNLNMTLNIREVDTKEIGEICASGDYELGPAQCGITGVPTIDITPEWTHRFTCDGKGNFTNYCNREFDAVVAKLNVELDPAKRYSLFRDAEAILDADPPVILIGGDQVDPVWNRDFKGLNLHARAWGQWGRFETGWLDK
jgi:ABC-type transport system substrate-binding protein